MAVTMNTEVSMPAAPTETSTTSEMALARSMPDDEPAPACALVIFGAGGDLTKRLLMPALYNPDGAGLLDQQLQIIGVDRADFTDEGCRVSLTDTMQSFTTDTTAEFHAASIDPQSWGWVRERLVYVKGDFDQPDLYAKLSSRLTGNAVFYLAVAARVSGPSSTIWAPPACCGRRLTRSDAW